MSQSLVHVFIKTLLNECYFIRIVS